MTVFLSSLFPGLAVIKNRVLFDVVLPSQTTPSERYDPGPKPWVYIIIGAVIVIIIFAAVMVIKRITNIKPRNN
jgi:hypothetical protein